MTASLRRALLRTATTPERRLLLLCALTRLIPAALVYGTEDVSAWHRCGAIMAGGGNPYSVPLLISWPPLWPLYSLFSYSVAEHTWLPFPFVVKLLPIAADIIITFVLYASASTFGLPPFRTAIAYALNPVAIYTTAIHGNFDAIPALCLCLAVIAASRADDDPSGVRAGVWAGIGAAFKTWPLLVVPSLVARARARKFVTTGVVAAAIFLAALLLPWPFIGRAGVASILRYRGFQGWWGLTSIVFLRGGALPARSVDLIFYAAMIGVSLLLVTMRTPAPRGALLLLITFFVTTPGFGIQYLLWIVPVALLADRRHAVAYSLLAGALILFELIARPYTGHPFDSIRFLPHADFARNWGGRVDQRYTSLARLTLWSFFVYWWIRTLAAVVLRRE